MKRYATTLLIWLALVLNEAHCLFEGSTATFTFHGVEMTRQWFVWSLGNTVYCVLIGLAMMRYEANRINRTTVLSFVLFSLADLVMFAVNYRSTGYWFIYTMLFPGWVIIYNWQGVKAFIKALFKRR